MTSIHHAPDMHPAPPAIAARPAVVTPLAPGAGKQSPGHDFAGTRTTSCDGRRNFCGTPSRAAIPPPSSNARCRYWWMTSSASRCAATKTPRPAAGCLPGSRLHSPVDGGGNGSPAGSASRCPRPKSATRTLVDGLCARHARRRPHVSARSTSSTSSRASAPRSRSTVVARRAVSRASSIGCTGRVGLRRCS